MLPVVAVFMLTMMRFARQIMSGHDSKRVISMALLWLSEDSIEGDNNCSVFYVDSHSEMIRELPEGDGG